MEIPWGESWGWGLMLITVTTAIHAMGVVVIFRGLQSSGRLARTHERQIRHPLALAVTVIATVGLLLAVLHGLEAFVWAVAYLLIGAIGSEREAMLYSLDSLTTRGTAVLLLDPKWRLMASLESADGMLLFGISTAFVFTVIQRIAGIIDQWDRSLR
jgi:hypothetical protein